MKDVDARSVAKRQTEIARLKNEVQARIAEANWLKAHYERHLREALATAYTERPTEATCAAVRSDSEKLAEAELATLRREVERMSIAERRYLDRIDELKEEVASASARDRA